MNILSNAPSCAGSCQQGRAACNCTERRFPRTTTEAFNDAERATWLYSDDKADRFLRRMCWIAGSVAVVSAVVLAMVGGAV
jgi:hypothetical protein